tara:strand:- start:262 stop:576 length:315 start_codon:yes stop_codon:yes gene_type:complete
MSWSEQSKELHDFEVLIDTTSYTCQATLTFNYHPGEPTRQPTHLKDDGDPGCGADFDNYAVELESVSWEDEDEREQTDINDAPVENIKECIIQWARNASEDDLI